MGEIERVHIVVGDFVPGKSTKSRRILESGVVLLKTIADQCK